MRKLLHLNAIIILLFAVFISAAGQYTGTNPDVAVSKKAFASDSVIGFEPAKAVDGLPGTYSAIPNGPPSWYLIDLGSFHYIDGYGMDLPSSTELPLAYTLQGSADGTEWFVLGTGASIAGGIVGYDLLNPDVYRYVRLDITAKNALASITEFFVYGYEILPPSAPLALAATNYTSSGFTANWGPISSATGYSLEVATDIDFNSIVTGYDDLIVGYTFSLEVVGLSHATTYYYRIKAFNEAGTSGGSNKISVITLNQSQTITFGALPAKMYGDATFDLTATASSGLTVTYASSDESVATVIGSTVTVVGVGITDITATQAGDAEYEAAVPVVQDLEVTTKALTVSGVNAADKVYDGLDEAVLSGGTLVGIVGADDVVLADATSGTFAQTTVGTGIVIATAMTLSGVDAGNYLIVQPTDVTAAITVKELTVTGTAADDKIYDGTTDALVSGGSLVGVIGADVVTLASATHGVFAQSDVGTAIGVTTSMTLSGVDASNYSIVQPTGVTAAITAKNLTVTPDGKSREACAPNPVFTVTYLGFVGAEDATVLISEPVATSAADATSTPGDYDITASGGDGGNYNLVFAIGILSITADITDPVLSVQNITIQLDDTGNASITPADVVSRAVDDCGVIDTTLSQSAFTTDNVGEVVVDVTVTDAAGNSTTEYSVVTVENPSGLVDRSELRANIYPNPTNGKVELELNTPADWLKVMDMTGKTVVTRSNLKSRESIDLSGYSNGIYIFQLQIGEEFMHIKVIKK